MFFIGELRDETKAKEIIHELAKQSIVAELRFLKDDDLWAIFVSDEQFVPLAHDLYRVKLGLKKPMVLDREWIEIKKVPLGFVTKIILIVSIVIFFLSYTEIGEAIYAQLMFSNPLETTHFEAYYVGEFYRLITPVFLHMSILHILFNMLWFKDLSSLLEDKFSFKFYLLFFLVTGIFSNLLQYLVMGPRFGGMSGVLYAMLGFFWIYKKSHKNIEYGIPDRDMWIMLIWFVFCLTGYLGPIANLAHAGGLTLGMIIALLVRRDAMSYGVVQKVLVFFSAILVLFATIAVESFKLKGEFYFQKILLGTI